MPNYRYQVRTNSGQVQSGTLAAENAGAAAAVLRNQGGHVLSLSAIQAIGNAGGFMDKLREMNAGTPTENPSPR